MDGVSRFPDIVTFQISLPLDQELKLFVLSKMAMCLDQLHLVFFFSTNEVRQWLGEVGAMCGGFAIGR